MNASRPGCVGANWTVCRSVVRLWKLTTMPLFATACGA